MIPPAPAAVLSEIIRARRSVRDFLPDPIPPDLLDAVLADANWAPSWSNTQPYRIAIASGDLAQRLKGELCERFDLALEARQGGLVGKLKLLATRKGLPDGDFATSFEYPADLQPRRRATGHGLYELLGIAGDDKAARNCQMRRNFEFFGAPTVIFVFAHRGLREFSILDAGIFLQTLLLSAQAHGLATCAQGALATWAGPVRDAFAIPEHYRLICGVSIGFAAARPINRFNPGRGEVHELLIPPR
ncbi:MAG: nitroreductase [Dechloromonas sp.]|nr:MAG: nitroreductase [Dechloromonas sp.]